MFPTLVQREPEPQHMKMEQEDLFQTQEGVPYEADGTMFTLLTVKRDIDVQLSTSPAHNQIPAGAEDCGTPQPADAQLLSSHCSESDTKERNKWDETGLSKLNSHRTPTVRQMLSLSKLNSQKTPTVRQMLGLSKLNSQKAPTVRQMLSMRENVVVDEAEQSYREPKSRKTEHQVGYVCLITITMY